MIFKKLLTKKRLIFDSAFLLFTLVLTFSNIRYVPDFPKGPDIKPNYILDGTYARTDGIFDYYLLPGDTYGISLKDSVKKTHSANIVIPSVNPTDGKRVTGIMHNAFHGNIASNITFRSDTNVTTIDFEAFMYSRITSIAIPYTVSEIGDAAFYSCSNLTTVNFINSNQDSSSKALDCNCEVLPDSEGTQYSTLTRIPSFCFFKCNSLTTLSLPTSIQEIAEEAFNGCSALSSNIYFQKIETIRSRAFQGCTSLRTIYISRSMFTDANGVGDASGIGIEPHAFNYCNHEGDTRLKITFCGDSTDINNWITAHPNWGWYNDSGNPATDKHNYDSIINADFFNTSEWEYTCKPNGDVTITKYKGSAPTAAKGFIAVPEHMPEPAGNRVVRVERNTFDSINKTNLKRLYLPPTLTAIENEMFRGKNYINLYVVDTLDACDGDYSLASTGREADIIGRIDLSQMDDLEFIGYRAFSGIGGNDNKSKIKELHLPARIRAIGDEAFGVFEQRMLPEVTVFTWAYDDRAPENGGSRLETIGTDAFYALGRTAGGTTQIKGNATWKAHTASTFIFPRKFKYFATLSDDKNRYKNTYGFDFGTGQATKKDRPAHAFAGCSLLGKVIFRGGSESETVDLIIPVQTFVFNESLQTIIFEERENHTITFHTQDGVTRDNFYGQESIGSNAGSGGSAGNDCNDFRGEPFLQTLILPNISTNLRMQRFAFHGNGRAAIYLSGTYGTNMYSDKKDGHWTNLSFENKALSLATQWKTVGNEAYFATKEASTKHFGFIFGSSYTSDYSSDESVNTFEINQETPVYDNVHYKETIDGINVEVGVSSETSRELVIEDKCSYVCGKVGENYVATMSNYMYSLYDNSASLTTATVKETVTAKINGTNRTCTVNKIGDAAFSCCFCDGQDTSPTKAVGSFDDLTTIVLPNTIKSIGDYAFIRTYGVTTIKSYSGNNTPVEGMPSSLEYIGKSAFLFCGVKAILNIPSTCKFFENSVTVPSGSIEDPSKLVVASPEDKIQSIFANALNLRQITFAGGSSNYYTVTTYTSATAGTPLYTCALYSTNDAGISFNKDRLLLVLNRDAADYTAEGAADTSAVGSPKNGIKFNGLYKTNPYMFGAFKMGVWIRSLICGNPTQSGVNTIPQPLFSPIGTKSSRSGTMEFDTDSYVYLGKIVLSYDRTAFKCNLDTIAGNVLNLPEYAMKGCEELANVEFPVSPGDIIPKGVFDSVENTDLTYYVTGDTPVAHALNLTNSQYAGIGDEAFKNNPSIESFTAANNSSFTVGASAFKDCENLASISFTPVSTDLTIGSSAFESCGDLASVNFGSLSGSLTIGSSAFTGCDSLATVSFGNVTGTVTINSNAFNGCSNLTTLDFRNVTGTLVIEDGAFASTGLTNILWPTSALCQVHIVKTGAFSGCTSLVDVSLPSTLYDKLGESTFEGCTNLEHVTVDGASIGITSIEASAFSGCGKLEQFEFSKFTSLTSIKGSAFANTGVIDSSGNIVLPSSVTSIGGSAFSGSDIVTMKITSSQISLGASAFASCSDLEAFRVTNPSCRWTAYNNGVFNNCPSLVELQLPGGANGFNLGNNSYNTSSNNYMVKNDSALKIFTYNKYSTSLSMTSEWRKYEAQLQIDDIYFYVETLSDLTSTGVVTGTDTVAKGTLLFWHEDASGNAILLGTVASYSGGNLVTFSNGYTLDSTGLHAPI